MTLRNAIVGFFLLLLFACSGYPPADPAAIRVAPIANGWVRVEQQPWFTVDMPATPRASKPKVTIPWFAAAQARSLECNRGRQSFSVLYVHSEGGWADRSRLLGDVVDELKKGYTVRSVHQTPDAADVQVETRDAVPNELHVLVASTSTLVVMMAVGSPRDRTPDESRMEMAFLRSVRDL